MRLALYHYDGCSYCRRVQRVLAELGLRVEERNILLEPRHLRELVEARGRRTVPVLYIEHADGRQEWMPESRDIIRYLRASFGPAQKPPEGGLLDRLLGRR